jgi:hypothetical protein
VAASETDKRPKIFYGWYVLGIGMLGVSMAAGTSQLFMSIMLKPKPLYLRFSSG